MYGIINEDNKLIAYHELKEPVEIYMESVDTDKKDNLKIIHIKKKYRDSIYEKYDDLHLVRLHNTYVQSGYLVYIKIASQDIVDDEEYAKDILLRIIETQNLNYKDTTKLMKAIAVLEKIIDNDRTFVPSLEELKRMKDHYDYYMYNNDLL